MVARDENRNRNGHVLVWDQADLVTDERQLVPDSMYYILFKFLLVRARKHNLKIYNIFDLIDFIMYSFM